MQSYEKKRDMQREETKKIIFLAWFQKKYYLCIVIQLGRHIEILLLDNDCVIVPDFGGFVAHHASAYYDEGDHMWLPPTRTLGFNAQLRINDSLLVQSYVTAYDISYPEALRRIEGEVNEMKRMLQDEGRFLIENIGTLTINSEGNYQFIPFEAGILSPEYYGLGGCEFITLNERRIVAAPNIDNQMALSQTAEEQQDEPQADGPTLLDFTDEQEEQYERTIHIKMSWIRNTVAIAAAVIAFFIMATPIANSNLGTRTMSHLKSNLLYKLIPQDTNMMPATPVAEVAAPTPSTAETVTTDTPSQTAAKDSAIAHPTATAPKKVSRPYCIVLASQVKKSNAEYYVEQLKKEGYDAEVYIHNDIVRVVMGAYETEAEAYRQLNKVNTKEEFYEAWVYKRVES